MIMMRSMASSLFSTPTHRYYCETRSICMWMWAPQIIPLYRCTRHWLHKAFYVDQTLTNVCAYKKQFLDCYADTGFEIKKLEMDDLNKSALPPSTFVERVKMVFSYNNVNLDKQAMVMQQELVFLRFDLPLCWASKEWFTWCGWKWWNEDIGYKKARLRRAIAGAFGLGPAMTRKKKGNRLASLYLALCVCVGHH